MILYKGDNPTWRRYSIAMVALAVFFLAPLFAEQIWEAGMVWQDGRTNESVPSMLVAMYVALSICLVMAAKDPLGNAIIIDYVIVSSWIHGLVMAYFATILEWEHTHLIGDVPMLIVVAIVFMIYHPRRLARKQLND